MTNGKSGSSKKPTSKSKMPANKADTSKKQTAQSPQQSAPKRRELAAVVFLFIGLFTIIGYFNTDGAFIAFISNLLRGIFGWGFWFVPPCLLLCAYILGFHRGRPVTLRVTCALLIPLIFAVGVHLLAANVDMSADKFLNISNLLYNQGLEMKSGGVFGGLLAEGLRSAFSIYGAFPLTLIAFAFCVIAGFNIKISDISQKLKNRERVEYQPEDADNDDIVPEPVKTPARSKASQSAAQEQKQKTGRPAKSVYPIDIPLNDGDEDALPINYISYTDEDDVFKPVPKKPKVRPKAKAEEKPVNVEPLNASARPAINTPVDEDGFRDFPLTNKSKAAPVPLAAEIADPPKSKKAVKAEVAAEAAAVAEAISDAQEPEAYKFPPVDLLRAGNIASIDYREEISINRERLEGAIHSFGISAAIVGVTRGPTVTRYDIELDQGVKLARITNLAGDLALALGVVNVRIAPIPDKISTVGIEVPNKIVSTVYLRDIIESGKFKNAKSKLSFAIGKDIGGDSVVGNISKLPHLLIAGTTGSGKSVCMNSLILSILYKATPDEVRLIMIDPKMVELGIYNGIPHLFVPVVTDPKKAAGALQWSVVEMLKRYRLFSEVGVRDLASYNEHCRANGESTMPQVVIVIDELADLMLVASKEVEESICRVAQMGRAAGMHLVIATQRPSADVITGLMKANIPSRIAFAVSSAMESRIILDQAGAEKLVGMGDMLFSPVGCGKPTRIQGAFVSDEEREDVVQFIKESAASANENSEIEEFMNKAAEDKKSADNSKSDDGAAASEFDEMLPQAVEAVLEMKQCSTSMLQRRVKLGYSRAARIVDQMEELGIVGAYQGAKPRDVLIDRGGWHDIQIQLGMIPADPPDMIDYNEEE